MEIKTKILPLFLFLTLLSLFLLLGENLGLIKFFRGLGQNLTNPLQAITYRAGQNLESLFKAQNQAQTEVVRQSANLSVQLKALEEENQALRKQLGAPLPSAKKLLPAKTLGLVRYLTLDKGEDDGLQVGRMVVSENNLVGKIIEVTPRTAQVLLPSDPDSKIAVKTLNTEAQGLAVGEFGTKIILDKVLQAEDLVEEDLVMTLGDGGYLPDLIIGKIGKITKNEVEPFQQAEILPLLDYQKLVNVFVIR